MSLLLKKLCQCHYNSPAVGNTPLCTSNTILGPLAGVPIRPCPLSPLTDMWPLHSPSFSPCLPQPRQSPIASSCSHAGPPPRSSCSPAAHPTARRHRAPPARPAPRSSCCCTRPARRHALLLLAGSELRPRAPPVLAVGAVQEAAAAAAVLHGSAHRGELGRSLQHLGLPRRRSPNPSGRSAGGGAARSMRGSSGRRARIHGEAARGRGLRRAPSRGAAGGAAGGGVGVSSPSSIDGGARPAAVWLAPHGRPPARSAGGGAARSTRMPARALGRRRAGGPLAGEQDCKPACE